MPNAAPYQFDFNASDDATCVFSIDFTFADGEGFPFDEYEFDYVVSQCGRQVLLLTPEAGLTIVPPSVTFRAPKGSLRAGVYEHGCRIRHIGTGDRSQLFDGTLKINEGNYE